jgi:hypothetical protein
MNGRHVIFVLNLLQDVSVIRPIAYLAGKELDVAISYLVSARFLERDSLRLWQRELARIAADTGGSIHLFETPADACAVLQGKRGIIIAASESTLSGHAETHNVFRIAPPSFLKVTLQHGFECVGFLQNREQVIASGRNVKFAADVICGWCEAPTLTALAASERPKLYVTGPPMLLNAPPRGDDAAPVSGGLVCENLHSARLKATGDHGKSFMDQFTSFCGKLASHGQSITLRPHPGGMYVLKNNVALPSNVTLNSSPMYKVDLSAFTFGISAPSTVVFDMVLAGIPVAVWRDPEGIMDASNYDGLTAISTLQDWFDFIRDSVFQRDQIISQQQRFMSGLAMPTDPADVYGRFARLLANGTAPLGEVQTGRPKPARPPRRISVLANGHIPTLQLSFLKPLEPLIASGELAVDLITEVEANELFPLKPQGKRDTSAARLDMMGSWIKDRLASHKPDLILACRYSAPCAERIVSYARKANVPLIYHIDDDLLNIPPEIGYKKYLAHNNPGRLKSVDVLLRGADLVYCSTRKLKSRLRQLSYRTPMVEGRIYCSGEVLAPAVKRPVAKVGYMGFDHAHDFEIVLPQLVRYLRRNTEVTFELFGSIPKPPQLDEFGARVRTIEPVRNYEDFMKVFATLEWDIGLCPLAATPFNEVKANTKWVEYTSVGAAVLATRGLVYDTCCADGCGMLLDRDDWLGAMEDLTDNPEKRYEMVRRAQRRVETLYSVPALRDQVLSVFAKAQSLHTQGAGKHWPHLPPGPMARSALPLAALIG